MNLQRYYLALLGDSYEQKGTRVNDEITLTPAIGRKKKIILNRKSYLIESFDGEVVQIENSSILLPKLINEEFKFELILTNPSPESKSEDRLRYLLKAMTNTPFRHNGSLVFEAFIERGDLVTIGYNKFKFEFQFEEKEFNEMQIDKRILQSNLNILIQGETGTGKSTLAKKIHNESSRNGKFVHLNLSSFASNLIESELFGHNKGAFTGAISNKEGAFAQAHHGTLFIDEIDSLSFDMQTKLLLFLDNGYIRPVGSNVEQKVDVRLIVASGSSLEGQVKLGKMRRDFYYRISSGVQISLPPLNKCKHKINYFLNEFMQNNGVYIESKLQQFYLSCPWPGNLRQLEGHLQKKLILSKGHKIVMDTLDEMLVNVVEDMDTEMENFVSMKSMKIEYAKKVLLRFDGNINQAARAIGITPKTMRTLAS